ncbi:MULTISPECIES: LysR family transcriptional regulator [unclassified Bradyrhizobium]|uniref:LysR family transcriptional regulator n=1 Tax=unclassified Bradyrhizobium TaxID=2631580 RepID=UPI001FFA9C19|nr:MULTISPECIES: LysR family transcriptional regulator [unclassified Bradyrhizobium]MCK1711390.1 LysR family transcriptional regulator [Bradyrhizobium sp. 143]MCK1731663.1 LysR family transcriptional regulator [Bradyrhizobium sp. 142]
MDRLDQMRLFIRVVETASFSKAAKAEGVVQSTVSKQVSALEAVFGVQLLRRTSRGMSVTESGLDFYKFAVGCSPTSRRREYALAKGSSAAVCG